MSTIEHIEHIEQAAQLDALFSANRYVEAEALARLMIQSRPDHGTGWKALGAALAAQRRFEEALPVFERSLLLSPADAELHATVGNALGALGRTADAEQFFRRAVQLKPDLPVAHNNLGVALKNLGRTAEAEACYRRALELSPGYVEAQGNLGNLLLQLGRLPEAESSYRMALDLVPDHQALHNNLGIALREMGRLAEAEASCRRALRYEPQFFEAHSSLGNALRDQGRFSEAAESYRRALAIKPGYVEAHNHLGIALQAVGEYATAHAEFRRALELEPGFRQAHSNLLLAMNYTGDFSRKAQFEEHLAWAQRFEAPLAERRRPFGNSRDPQRRLRVGYVSPDFKRHSVACFVEPLLASHDRHAFEVLTYSSVAQPDAVTRRLLALPDCARSIVGLSDASVAELVRADGIDILVDLAGHTARAQLGLFALKPAPVQVSYLGYPGTSGLASMDWRLTDIHADPPGDGDAFHSEKLARLPETFLCYRPPADAPDVQPPPSLESGVITFASFNMLTKVTPEVIRAWARLLGQVPEGRILLKALALADPPARERVIGEFARHGVAPERVSLLPMDPGWRLHLARYHEVDIGLDPFPYNGTATTFEALWMGVPVVSLRGDRHATRVGSSILANVGLDDLVAESPEQYIALAANLAADGDRLASLRGSLRERMRASPLLDEARFCRHLETAYRSMWRYWCLEKAPAPIEIAADAGIARNTL